MEKKTGFAVSAVALACTAMVVGCGFWTESSGISPPKAAVEVHEHELAVGPPQPEADAGREVAAVAGNDTRNERDKIVAAKAPSEPSIVNYGRHELRALGYMGSAEGFQPRGGVALSQSMVLHDSRSRVAPGWALPPFHTEQYDFTEEEGFLLATHKPLSTFSIDVDTASYSNLRRFLNEGSLPPQGAVRIEELLNYFSYDYPRYPENHPFSVVTEVATTPWNDTHRLLLIGIQGKEVPLEKAPPRNLVFLIDVSGSMMPENKLPLLKRGLRELVGQLRPEDHVAITVYAGASGLVLPPTSGARKNAILEALERLQAGGSTNGGEGIRLAYETVREHFDKKGINRVILATDGDFNVGTTSRSDLVQLIEKERESGAFLTVLGVGTGNLKDATMEELADHGNGNYAYLDTYAEARKVLIEEAGGTLITIAKDVKIQVEFNPSRVSAYRLIGYENRRLEDKDFNDDTKDAGEIGAGHSVTALYEIVPVGTSLEGVDIDPLRYQQPREPSPAAKSDELVTVKLRYKEPDGKESRLLGTVVKADEAGAEKGSENLRFAAAVAAFGMVLQDSEYRGDATLAMAQKLGREALGKDPHAYRAEFLRLVALAKGIDGRPDATTYTE